MSPINIPQAVKLYKLQFRFIISQRYLLKLYFFSSCNFVLCIVQGYGERKIIVEILFNAFHH